MRPRVLAAVLAFSLPALAVSATNTLQSLLEQARHLELRTGELRMEIDRQARDTAALAARREQVRAREAEVAELGPKFVGAKPSARSHSPEQVADYNQLQSQLAGAEAKRIEGAAAVSALERDVAARSLLIDVRLREDRAEAAALEGRLHAMGISLPGLPGGAPPVAASAERPLGSVRRELANERQAADELRARVAYDMAVKDAGDPETGRLRSELGRHEARVQALQHELASLQVARARDSKKPRGSRASVAGPGALSPVVLALAGHRVLALEQELATSTEASRRSTLEEERLRWLAVVRELGESGRASATDQ